jgi:hypothetical protein
MAAIRLLAASVETPSTSEANPQYLTLVPTSRPPVAAWAITRNDPVYQDDDFVWSASAGSDGSFTFSAASQKNSGTSNDSSRRDGSPATQVSGSDWYMSNAIFQYALHTSLSAPMSGQLINLYA